MMSFWVVPASWWATSLGVEVGVLLLGDDLVEREQPHRGGVDRHRGVHLGERDVVEEPPHLAEVRDRDADLADLAAAERVVGVVAGLGRQVEGDRQAGLALREVGAVERVGRGRGRVAGVRPHHPGPVLLGSWIEGRTRATGGNRSRVWGYPHPASASGGGALDLDEPDQPGQVQHPDARPGRSRAASRWWPVRAGLVAGDGEHPERGDVDGVDVGEVDDDRRARARRAARGARCGPPACCARRSRRSGPGSVRR